MKFDLLAIAFQFVCELLSDLGIFVLRGLLGILVGILILCTLPIWLPLLLGNKILEVFE